MYSEHIAELGTGRQLAGVGAKLCSVRLTALSSRFRFVPNVRHAPFTYAPFSLGASNCLGQVFANSESLITLAAIYNRYETRLNFEPDEFSEHHEFIMRPKVGSQALPIKLKRRQSVTPTIFTEY